MTISVTLTYPDVDSFLAAMAKLGASPAVSETAAPATATKAAKAAKAAPAPEPSATPAAAPVAAPAPAAVAVAAPAPAPAAEFDAGSAKAVSYDAVAKAITEKIKSDRAGVIAALAKFGAKKGTELKPDQFGAFIEALD